MNFFLQTGHSNFLTIFRWCEMCFSLCRLREDRWRKFFPQTELVSRPGAFVKSVLSVGVHRLKGVYSELMLRMGG